MARTISTKLAVEGEAQYKQAIAACNSELSTLKSGLALVESEFRGNANSMEALTAKGAALDSMYKKQQEKVSTLEAALRNAQRAQEEYSSRVSTAQSNIERCERALETLRRSTGDTSREQEALTKELDKWNAELEEAQAGQAAAERGVQNWQKQLNGAKIELNTLSDEIGKNNGYLSEARASADGCANSIDKYGKETKKAGEESGKFGERAKSAIDNLATVLAAAGIAKTVKEIADTLMECAKAAESFETSMAKVSTLADTSVVPLETLKTELVTLSGETGVAVGALAEAAYQALSAGVDTADVVNFVATATKTSAAGFTEASTAVDVLTTAINSYKLEGTEAERVASMLVKTQDEGKTSVGELAANMGRVIPSAAAYNVSLENLTTAYAILTKSGTNTAISTTNLGAMFDELAKNGSNVAGILEDQTGKSFSELMASGSNLGDIMAILSDSVNGDATAFSNLWSSTTAGKAALSLLNAGAEEFDRTLGVMANSSGSVERNFQIMADTTEFAHQRMTNAAENLKIAVGDQLNPSLERLYDVGTDAFTWAADFANEHPAVVKAVAAVVIGLGTLAAGVTAVVAATAALDVVMEANPIGLIAAATVAAVAAVGAFAFMMTSASEETKAFTGSLQDTKAAYEELSETMEAEQESTAASAAALEELLAVEEKSAAQKAAISELVNQLNESVPGLNLAYDAERDALEGLTAAEVSAMVEKAAAQEEYEAQVARLSELYTEQSEISARLEEAQEALNTAQETGSGNTRTLQNDINELTAAQEENAAQIAELEEASREYGEKQAEAAAKTQEMTSRVEDITAKMETLQAAYEESYNAAMESIDGQLGLFNELDGSAKTSIDNLIGTLQGQVSYMETYAANIQKAMELGVDEGLIKKLSDGSEESAQILAAIVEGGEEDIAALNEQLAKVEKGKEAFSETVAEMETDFSDQMEELVRDLDDAIQDMDLSDDAYQIGENNMQGLIDGTASKKAELVRKYAEMGRAALAAYKKEVEQASPSKKFNEAGRFDIQGIIKGAEAEKANLAETYADAGRTVLSAMEKSLPSRVEEPPASAAINRQTAAIVAAVRGQDGGTPGGIAIYVDKLEVRDDSDVERVARELYYLTEQKKRSRGGGSL
nr:phage tail tape measure protein [uncultured Oscillibacter sp.]